MPEKKQEANSVTTPGRLLSAAREASDKTQADIAKLTRLPLSVIQEIEGDHYAEFGSSTFVRGYLKSYARLVGIEEAQITAALDTSNLLSNPSYTTTASVGGAPVMNVTRQKQTMRNPGWVIAGCAVVLVIALSVVWKVQDHMVGKKIAHSSNTSASLTLPTQTVMPVTTATTTSAAPTTTAPATIVAVKPAKNIWVKKKDIGKIMAMPKSFKPTYVVEPVKNT